VTTPDRLQELAHLYEEHREANLKAVRDWTPGDPADPFPEFADQTITVALFPWELQQVVRALGRRIAKKGF
jgi:hypothetical protein